VDKNKPVTVKETDQLLEEVVAELDQEDPTLEICQANIAKHIVEDEPSS
jgi:hypothetical protein